MVKNKTGGGQAPWAPPLDPSLYSTYNAEDNKLNILAVEVLTHLHDPSDLKKKIVHLHQQSAILLLFGEKL